MRLLLVDNYDSFTFNIVEMLRQSGCRNYNVLKSDAIGVSEAAAYSHIIFSPGPGLPADYPVMSEILSLFDSSRHILGICLGHQAIAMHYGAKLKQHKMPLHGKSSEIVVQPMYEPLFGGLPDTFSAGRYHSWYVHKDTLPDCLDITSMSSDGIIMSVSHKRYSVKGLQFHPESYISGYGQRIISNWLLL